MIYNLFKCLEHICVINTLCYQFVPCDRNSRNAEYSGSSLRNWVTFEMTRPLPGRTGLNYVMFQLSLSSKVEKNISFIAVIQ